MVLTILEAILALQVFVYPDHEWHPGKQQAWLFGPQDHTQIILAEQSPRFAPTSQCPMLPKELREQLDISRERGARRRIIESWDDIELEYGQNADGRQVLRVLNRDQDAKKPSLKTVQNHLSKLRAEGLIP